MYQSLSYNTDKAIAPQKHWNTSHKQACQHAQNLALRHLTSQHKQHQKRLQPKKFKACANLAYSFGLRAWHGHASQEAGDNHSSMGWGPSSRASILYLLRSGRRACTCFLQNLQRARHLFCLLRISLDNFCADTRVVCWCPNDSAYNGKQQHTKNRATQLHDNTVGSPAGFAQQYQESKASKHHAWITSDNLRSNKHQSPLALS